MVDKFRLINNAAVVSATAAVVNWSTALPTPAPDYYGPRQWNPGTNRWSTWPQPGYNPATKTCVLIHGIASRVETAFPDGSNPMAAAACDPAGKTGAVSRIAAANGCQQVLGYNYIWLQTVNKSGTDFASFLLSTGLKEVTVEAHSLGSVVSVAALGRIPESQMKVTNLITLGGPHLGTSFGEPGNALSLLAMLVPPTSPVAVAAAMQSSIAGFAADMAPGNETLATNLRTFVDNHPDANVIAIGGGGTELGPTVDQLIFGGKATDGIVDTASAICAGCPIPRLNSAVFPLKHTGLECSQDVIDFVSGKIASPANGALILTINTIGPGVVTPDKPGPTYLPGTVVTLTAKANPGATFTGWSGACSATGSCVVTMTSNATVTATFKAPFTLSVVIAGSGSGTVTANPLGFSYTADTPVTLTAAPDAQSTFAGWGGASGACTGIALTCTLKVKGDDIITANFNTRLFTLNVSKIGTGDGVVSPNKTGPYSIGTVVVLTATPDAQSTFAGWGGASGACTGTALTCSVTVKGDDIITATFNTRLFTLNVSNIGTGAGVVSANKTGPYANGTVVILTATPATGSTFGGWSGGGCSGTGTCTLTVTASTTVTATFTLTAPPSGTLSSTWTGTWTYPVGNFCAFMTNAMTWNLTQTGTAVRGTYSYLVTAIDPEGFCPNAVGDRFSGNLGNGVIIGSTLTFDTFGNRGFTGTINGNRITGTGGTSAQTTGPFSLTKQ